MDSKPKTSSPSTKMDPKPKTSSPSEQLDSSSPPSSFGKPLSKQYLPPATTAAKANLAKLVEEEATARGLDANSDTASEGDPDGSSDFEQLKQAFLPQRRAFISKRSRSQPTIGRGSKPARTSQVRIGGQEG
jgi:hypothetical protein